MKTNKMKKLIFLGVITLFFTSCVSQKQISGSIKKSYSSLKNTVVGKEIPNPYKNLNDEDKITALTNYFIKKELYVKKPTYPLKPSKPIIAPAKDLIKGKFEKTVDFRKRLENEKRKRENYINNLEESYKKSVISYNTEVKRLTDEYNNKIEMLNSQIGKISANAMAKAYYIVYGEPTFKVSDYDADNELYYGNIVSKNGNFNKKVAVKMPPYIAQKYEKYLSKNAKVVFEYKNGNVFLKDIKMPYRFKEYHAMLTDTDYKASQIKVAVETRKLNIEKSKLISSSFKASKQDFNIGNINYGKSKVAKLTSADLKALNEQRLKTLNENFENLDSLLQKAPKVSKNPKAYAVIFGIENYLLESDVSYSQNSAMSFMQYASKTLGVPDDNIWAFVGNKTTSGFIKSQWQDFLTLVDKDAVIYFYYSGHGVPGDDGNSYILPSDTNAETATNDKTFMLNNIYSNLSSTRAKRVIAFVDSCFSGKDEKGDLLFTGVAPVLKVKKTKFDESKMTIFTAGSSKNFSNQYKEKQQRLFSYYLMKGLSLGKTDTQELFEYVRKNVANKSRKLGVAYKQIPELAGNKQGTIR